MRSLAEKMRKPSGIENQPALMKEPCRAEAGAEQNRWKLAEQMVEPSTTNG
jgi:hypothetical protein